MHPVGNLAPHCAVDIEGVPPRLKWQVLNCAADVASFRQFRKPVTHCICGKMKQILIQSPVYAEVDLDISRAGPSRAMI